MFKNSPPEERGIRNQHSPPPEGCPLGRNGKKSTM